MAVAGRREPKAWDFVRLKVRLLRNGLRGQVWRVLAVVTGVVVATVTAGATMLGLATTGWSSWETGYVVAALTGAGAVVSWVLVPLLFFGVDETLDPARFALFPLRRMTIARGMLAAAFVGVPAVATLVATGGLVIAAWIRWGGDGAAVAAVGVVAGLVLCVIASRAVTSAFATLLRSRRVRDLAAVAIALLAASIAPLQWVFVAAAQRGSIGQALPLARVLAWTPLGAPYVLAYDAASGRWVTAGLRLAATVVTIALLLWWWSRTLESAMLGASTSGGPSAAARSNGAGRGAVASLIPLPMRGWVRPGVFGAVLARESRFWWRDGRRRASLVSILMASAMLPVAFHLATLAGADIDSRGAAVATGVAGAVPFSFAVTMAGTMGGMLLGNQFAFDGSAYAAHLLGQVSGRVELRARAAAIAVVAIPTQIVVVVGVSLATDRPQHLPAGLGILAASFGVAVAVAALLSVLAPYSLPENSNPFALNSGGTSAKGLLSLLAMLATIALSMPVLVVAATLTGIEYRVWVILAVGLIYGIATAWLGTYIAGDVLQRRGPEILFAVTPRR